MKGAASLKIIFYLSVAVYSTGSLADSLSSKLLKIEDGDTIVVDFEGAESRIQLSSIDAPENIDNAKLKHDIKRTGLDAGALQVIGKAATEHLQSLLPLGSTVMINANMDEQDKYGRIPAIVTNFNGLQLNEKMVEDGYAAVLTRYPLDAEFKIRLQHKQSQARKAIRGLWGRYPETTKAWFGG